jgi:hypothetical protein
MKFFLVLLALLATPAYADDGIITKPSNHSVPDTINRFEAAVKARERVRALLFSLASIMPLRASSSELKCALVPYSSSAIQNSARLSWQRRRC